MDTVIRNWVVVMFPMEAGTERMGETIQELTAFFYVYDGLVVLLHPEKFQRAFNVLP